LTVISELAKMFILAAVRVSPGANVGLTAIVPPMLVHR
jgi:hypothetical protein